MSAPGRVLVTGGLGFQGLHLAERLSRDGRDVTVLNTPSVRALRVASTTVYESYYGKVPGKLRVVYGSAADPEILEKLLPAFDAVVHMAAWASVDVSIDRPWPPHEINATGTLALLDGLRRFGRPGCRVLIASSCEVYGPAAPLDFCADGNHSYHFMSVEDETTGEPDHPASECPRWKKQRETDEHRPRSPYAASKAAADRYAYAYAVTYGMDLTILRPCNVYGPRQRAGAAGAVVPTMTRAALAGEPVTVTGGGAQSREFAHVSDVVDAYRRLLDRPAAEPGEAFNLATGELRTVAEIAEAVSKRYGVPVERSAARVSDVSAFRLDGTRLRNATGWYPAVRFDVGLASYFAWAESREGRAWLAAS